MKWNMLSKQIVLPFGIFLSANEKVERFLIPRSEKRRGLQTKDWFFKCLFVSVSSRKTFLLTKRIAFACQIWLSSFQKKKKKVGDCHHNQIFHELLWRCLLISLKLKSWSHVSHLTCQPLNSGKYCKVLWFFFY